VPKNGKSDFRIAAHRPDASVPHASGAHPIATEAPLKRGAPGTQFDAKTPQGQ
jgi:hypothetical protein